MAYAVSRTTNSSGGGDSDPFCFGDGEKVQMG